MPQTADACDFVLRLFCEARPYRAQKLVTTFNTAIPRASILLHAQP
jgi:hypothetical protein